MVSLAFIAEHWVSLIFGLISTGAVAYCRMYSLLGNQALDVTDNIMDRRARVRNNDLAPHDPSTNQISDLYNSNYSYSIGNTF